MGTRTCDYKRHGTSIFTALNVASGALTSKGRARRRHEEYLTFPWRIDGAVPRRSGYLILDSDATRQRLEVQNWLDQHPRFHSHFTPASSSWLSLVVQWFNEITK